MTMGALLDKLRFSLPPASYMDWMDTALKKDVQIRHPKEEVGRLARSERVRYCVWIEKDGIAGSSRKSVNTGEKIFNFGNERYCWKYGGC